MLDEADRMLDLGFEPHIRAIAQQTRADRQTLMFSATWPPSIQKLAAEFLSDPVKVTIGSADLSASHSVSQVRRSASAEMDIDSQIKNEMQMALTPVSVAVSMFQSQPPSVLHLQTAEGIDLRQSDWRPLELLKHIEALAEFVDHLVQLSTFVDSPSADRGSDRPAAAGPAAAGAAEAASRSQTPEPRHRVCALQEGGRPRGAGAEHGYFRTQTFEYI